jgi:hypothetical protein
MRPPATPAQRRITASMSNTIAAAATFTGTAIFFGAVIVETGSATVSATIAGSVGTGVTDTGNHHGRTVSYATLSHCWYTAPQIGISRPQRSRTIRASITSLKNIDRVDSGR